MSQKQFIDLEETYGAHNYKPFDVVLHRGQGIWVWDVDGNRYPPAGFQPALQLCSHPHLHRLAGLESDGGHFDLHDSLLDACSENRHKYH